MADPQVVDEKAKGKKDADKKETEGQQDAGKAKAAVKIAINPMLIVSILALVMAVGGAFFLVKTLTPKPVSPAPAVHEELKDLQNKPEDEQGNKEDKQAAKKKPAAKKAAHGGAHGEGGGEESPFFSFEKPFVVNIAETNGERYLKVEFTLQMDAVELAEEIKTKKPQIMDLLINILSTKTLDTVSSTVGKNMLKQEIIDKINAQLETGRIVTIYFTEFVVQ